MLARIGGFIDAVPRHDVAADARLAHPDVYDVGVRLGHGNGAHRRALHLAVGDGSPGHAAIGGLPEPTADGAEVRLAWAALHATRGDRAAAAVGTDAPPLVALEDGGIERRGRRARGAGSGGVSSARAGRRGHHERGRSDRNAGMRLEHFGVPRRVADDCSLRVGGVEARERSPQGRPE